ncbi:MAG: hypothetical protein ACREA7_01025 [Nitrosotalea sp.]
MRASFGIIIIVGCLLMGVFVMADFLIPQVICKTIPPDKSVMLYAGQYNPNVFGDICSALT